METVRRETDDRVRRNRFPLWYLVIMMLVSCDSAEQCKARCCRQM